MEDRAGEAGDAPGGEDQRIAGIVADVADQVVRVGIEDMLDGCSRPGPRVRQEPDGPVVCVDVVERDPAREVGLVRIADEAGVLMPCRK